MKFLSVDLFDSQEVFAPNTLPHFIEPLINEPSSAIVACKDGGGCRL